MIPLNRQNLEYILHGSALLGSGGGGEIKAGKQFIQVILKQKHVVNLVNKPTGGFAFVLADIGAVSAIEASQEKAIYHAYDILNNYFKKNRGSCTCLFAVETGPENTMAAIVAAAKNKISVFDGDGAGRAVPQIQLCSYASAGLRPAPAAITNDKSDALIVFCDSPSGMDSLLRPVTAAPEFGNSASLAMFPATDAQLAKGCVKGSISYSLYTGMLLQGIVRKDKKLIDQSRKKVNGRRGVYLAKGRVVNVTDQVSGAFDIGSVTLKCDKGEMITIYNQNENLIAFSSRHSQPLAVAPHSICYLKNTLEPITNGEIKKNDVVHLIGVEAVRPLMTPSVLAGFQSLLNGLGYGGKAGVMDSSFKLKPLGDLLISLRR